jgi:thioredoxin-related protein
MIKHYLILALFLLSTQLGLADPDSTTNWADASASARENHSPIVVLFESQGCGYCMKLKREVLQHLPDKVTAQRPVIKEFDIYAGGKIIDFDGDPIRSRHFKERYHIFAVPTLIIMDAHGTPLTDPIVGYNSKEEYQELLNSSLITSYSALEGL